MVTHKVVEDVIDSWNNFVNSIYEFRKACGVIESGDKRGYELVTSLADKNGRVARQIKHYERGDPKSDWPTGMTQSFAGYLQYMIMTLDAYDVDLVDGLREELQSIIDQYADDINNEESFVTCRVCKGHKFIVGRPTGEPVIAPECPHCCGEGQYVVNKQWLETGHKIQQLREEKRLNMRETVKILQKENIEIDVNTLYRMIDGIIEPDDKILDIIANY